MQGENNKRQKLTKRLLKQYVVTMRFNKRNPTSIYDHKIFVRPDHELSFSEFKSIYSKEALRITEYSSSKSAEALLKQSYMTVIQEAVVYSLPGVNIEGIEMIRFRVESMRHVTKYCRMVNLNLS